MTREQAKRIVMRIMNGPKRTWRALHSPVYRTTMARLEAETLAKMMEHYESKHGAARG